MKKALIISITISLALCNLLGGVAPVLGGNTLYGSDNSIMNGQANLLLGDRNTLLQSSGNLVDGRFNLLGLSNFNQILGSQNILSNSQGNLVGGDGNTFINSDQNVNLGGSNTFLNSRNNFVAGGNNFVAGAGSNFISGAGNNVPYIPAQGISVPFIPTQGNQPLPQQTIPSPQAPILPVRPPTPIVENCDFPKEGFARFKADNGQYLRLCGDCGGYHPYCGVSIEANKEGSAYWKIIKVGNQISIQGSNGNYLSRCNNCWLYGAYEDSAVAHLKNNSLVYSKWTPEMLSNGKWAFKSDVGKYLSRCHNCAYTTNGIADLAFVNQFHAIHP